MNGRFAARQGKAFELLQRARSSSGTSRGQPVQFSGQPVFIVLRIEWRQQLLLQHRSHQLCDWKWQARFRRHAASHFAKASRHSRDSDALRMSTSIGSRPAPVTATRLTKFLNCIHSCPLSHCEKAKNGKSSQKSRQSALTSFSPSRTVRGSSTARDDGCFVSFMLFIVRPPRLHSQDGSMHCSDYWALLFTHATRNFFAPSFLRPIRR